MKPAPFEYCRPDTLEEAVALLAEFGDDALVMSGGLSLGAMLNMESVLRVLAPKPTPCAPMVARPVPIPDMFRGSLTPIPPIDWYPYCADTA